jgi:deoxyguanosine kinase
MKNTIISLEGNIGSGKSTLLKFLEEAFSQNKNIIFLKEPVDEWENIIDKEGTTMLEKFYSDQEKYSFPFQMMAYISRLAIMKKTMEENENCIIITERSLSTDKYVFAKMLYESGKIEDVCYKIYKMWFDTFAKDYPVEKMIYIKTSPETCHERITKRSRTGEEQIPLDYLKKCSEYHEDMMDRMMTDSIHQLELNGNVDIFENNYQKLNEWLKTIANFICI